MSPTQTIDFPDIITGFPVYSTPTQVDPKLIRKLRGFGKNHLKTLRGKNKRIIVKALKKYSKHFNQNTSSIKQWTQDPSADMFVKIFMLTEAARIPITSVTQSDAFLLLKGEELDCYVEQYVQQWAYATKNVKYDEVRPIPDSVRSLPANEDFKFEHIKPFLEYSNVSPSAKSDLLEGVGEGMQFYNKLLTKEQVDFMVNLAEKEKLDLTLFVESIKEAYNLQGMPNNWVAEMYGTIRVITE